MIITIDQLQVLLLILARVAGLFIDSPVLSSKIIPSPAKVALCIWISMVLWFVVPLKGPIHPVAFFRAREPELQKVFTEQLQNNRNREE